MRLHALGSTLTFGCAWILWAALSTFVDGTQSSTKPSWEAVDEANNLQECRARMNRQTSTVFPQAEPSTILRGSNAVILTSPEKDPEGRNTGRISKDMYQYHCLPLSIDPTH